MAALLREVVVDGIQYISLAEAFRMVGGSFKGLLLMSYTSALYENDRTMVDSNGVIGRGGPGFTTLDECDATGYVRQAVIVPQEGEQGAKREKLVWSGLKPDASRSLAGLLVVKEVPDADDSHMFFMRFAHGIDVTADPITVDLWVTPPQVIA